MKRIAEKKFPDVKDFVVPICFFLRFLCPTLLQPEQFGLMKGIELLDSVSSRIV